MSQAKLNKTAMLRALDILSSNGNMASTATMLRSGVHPRTLYALRDTGQLDSPSRGVFRLAESGITAYIDLETVCLRSPNAVICLVSALSYHELTTVIPSRISMALPKGAATPRIYYPPISVHRFSNTCYKTGIEMHLHGSVNIKVYSIEKTLVDCFKFRNQIGMDVVLEALRLYRQSEHLNIDKLMECARICRVANGLMPYLVMLMSG